MQHNSPSESENWILRFALVVFLEMMKFKKKYIIKKSGGCECVMESINKFVIALPKLFK